MNRTPERVSFPSYLHLDLSWDRRRVTKTTYIIKVFPFLKCSSRITSLHKTPLHKMDRFGTEGMDHLNTSSYSFLCISRFVTRIRIFHVRVCVRLLFFWTKERRFQCKTNNWMFDTVIGPVNLVRFVDFFLDHRYRVQTRWRTPKTLWGRKEDLSVGV